MWTRLDDQLADHPKIAAAGPLASWLFITAICYSSRFLTDGFVPAAVLPRLADFSEHKVDVSALADRLVQVGLFEPMPGKGYRIHDFLVYNPSRQEVAKQREWDRKRKLKLQQDSKRNPSGIHADSTGNPNGIQMPRTRTRTQSQTRTRPRAPLSESARTAPVAHTSPSRGNVKSQNNVKPGRVDLTRNGVVGDTLTRLRDIGVDVQPGSKGAHHVACLVERHGAERVKQAITDAGPEIGGARNPVHYLAAVCRGDRQPRGRKDQTAAERACEIAAMFNGRPGGAA